MEASCILIFHQLSFPIKRNTNHKMSTDKISDNYNSKSNNNSSSNCNIITVVQNHTLFGTHTHAHSHSLTGNQLIKQFNKTWECVLGVFNFLNCFKQFTIYVAAHLNSYLIFCFFLVLLYLARNPAYGKLVCCVCVCFFNIFFYF